MRVEPLANPMLSLCFLLCRNILFLQRLYYSSTVKKIIYCNSLNQQSDTGIGLSCGVHNKFFSIGIFQKSNFIIGTTCRIYTNFLSWVNISFVSDMSVWAFFFFLISNVSLSFYSTQSWAMRPPMIALSY